jgi:hypothetical protein
MKSMLVLTMTVASISTDMASLFERATRLQSVTSRSQKSLAPVGICLGWPPRNGILDFWRCAVLSRSRQGLVESS